MNPLFNNWLLKQKGITIDELKQKSQEKQNAMWKEYCEYMNHKAKEYNRALHPYHYE